jgi:thiaminase
MNNFHQKLLDVAQEIWNAFLNHRFLKMAATEETWPV